MIQALFSGASGLNSQQYRMDVIANNMANVDTQGYKAVRVDFHDALYQSMGMQQQMTGTPNLEKGHGVHVAATVRVFTQGAPIDTANMLDFAVEGNGYFAVRTPTNELRYTRDGAFALSYENDGMYLVNSTGSYVLGEDGYRIRVDGDPSKLSVDQNGYISIGTDPPFARFAIIEFANPEGLEAGGGNMMLETAASGQPMLSAGSKVRQGYLEGSTVDMAQEMTRLIRTQRAYSLASRVVTTADEMEGIANSMRR